MDNVIKSFLVSLGFKIDEAGLKKFDTQLKDVQKTVKEFAIGFTALAIGIEESIRRVGRNFEQLFYLSAQLGTSAANLKSLQFAFGQITGNTDAFKSSVLALNNVMLDSPGMKWFIATLAPGFDAATGTVDEALEGIVTRYREIQKLGEPGQLSSYRNSLRQLGVDVNAIHLAAQAPAGELEHWKKRAAETLKQLYDIEDATLSYKDVLQQTTAQSKAAMDEWNFAVFQVSNSWEALVASVMPEVKEVLEEFTKWMGRVGIPMVRDWIRSIKEWFKDTENQKSFKEALEKISTAAEELGHALKVLGGWILWLNKHLGATWTALLVLFSFTFFKSIIAGVIQGAIWLIFSPLVPAAATSGAAAATSFSTAFRRVLRTALKGIVAGYLAELGAEKLYNDITKGKPDRVGVPEGKEDWQWDINKAIDLGRIGHGIYKFFGGGGGEEGRPHSYSGPPTGAMGGDQSLVEMMVFGLQHWWAGSGNFRPYVALVDGVYSSFAEMLRDVFGLQPGGSSNKPGGEGSGSSGMSTARPGGRFAGAGPGGGGAGGGSAGVSLGQMKQLALDAGFSPEQASIMAATLMHESSGNPNALGAAGETGIAQVNPRAWGAELAQQSMGNAKRSMEIAFMIFQKQGMAAWASYTKGYYKQYLDAAIAAKPEAYNPNAGGAAGGGGRGGAMDPMAPAGTPAQGAGTVVVTSPSGRKFRVAGEFAANFKGFLSDYEKRGGVIGPASGGLSERPGNASYHPLGRAIDINQVGRDVRQGGKTLSLAEENELAESWGLYPGSKFRNPDAGHFEVRDARAAREALRRRQIGPQARATMENLQKVAANINLPQVGNYAQAFAGGAGAGSMTRGLSMQPPRPVASTHNVSVDSDQNIQITVNGSMNPHEVAQHVVRAQRHGSQAHGERMEAAVRPRNTGRLVVA